jgi:hypothetical protein
MSLCARLPWLVAQTEVEMLFLSWPVEPATIADRIPAGLTLETFEHRAWITLIPFRMERMRARGLPPIPPFSRYSELDCLTYVRRGPATGIWFFRIDAGTLVGATMGRLLFGLPYNHSRVSLDLDGEWRRFVSIGRADPTGKQPELRVNYTPKGPLHTATPGTLAHFIVERFVMFSRSGRGTLLSGREARAPRSIQECEFSILRNTIPEAADVPAPAGELTAWYCASSAIRTWLPAPIA